MVGMSSRISNGFRIVNRIIHLESGPYQYPYHTRDKAGAESFVQRQKSFLPAVSPDVKNGSNKDKWQMTYDQWPKQLVVSHPQRILSQRAAVTCRFEI